MAGGPEVASARHARLAVHRPPVLLGPRPGLRGVLAMETQRQLHGGGRRGRARSGGRAHQTSAEQPGSGQPAASARDAAAPRAVLQRQRVGEGEAGLGERPLVLRPERGLRPVSVISPSKVEVITSPPNLVTRIQLMTMTHK